MKGVHAFLKGISPKVKIRAWPEFKLVNFKAIVQPFSHYTMETPLMYCVTSHL